MDWNFKNNMDYIFDLFRKTARVISSCENMTQLEGAYNYVANVEKYLTHFERTERQEQFCEKQIAEFRKMLKVKNRAFNEFVD